MLAWFVDVVLIDFDFEHLSAVQVIIIQLIQILADVLVIRGFW